jgi:hypothetical protein
VITYTLSTGRELQILYRIHQIRTEINRSVFSTNIALSVICVPQFEQLTETVSLRCEVKIEKKKFANDILHVSYCSLNNFRE